MKVFTLLAICFSSKIATAQITSDGIVQFETPIPCIDIIASHEFQGDCCSLSDTDAGGCQLAVLGGTCTPSGSIWSESMVSTAPEACPEGDYDVLRQATATPTMPVPGNSASAAPTNQPVSNDTTAPSAAPIATPSPSEPLPATSSSPTAVPVVGTDAPTTAPIATPSPSEALPAPSSSPTAAPIADTSNSPTEMIITPSPTDVTGMPTISPTSKLITLSPTVTKTGSPTSNPTTFSSSEPTAQATSTQTASPSPAPTEFVPECTGTEECRNQFCGSDGRCYDYTCENFFLYNPVMEYSAESATELECKEVETDIHVTNFGCGRVVGSLASLDQAVGIKPNKLCTGIAREDTKFVSFECFALSDTTDFGMFISESAAASFDCNPTIEGLPAFFYSAGYTLSEFFDGSLKSKTVIANGPTPTKDFDRDSALKSLFAVVVKEDVTESPTKSPTPEPTATPIIDPSAGNFIKPLIHTAVASGVTLAVLLAF